MKISGYKEVAISLSAVLLLASCGGSNNDNNSNIENTKAEVTKTDRCSCPTDDDMNVVENRISTNNQTSEEMNKKEKLGEILFFDTNLSINENMSCATCHSPETGFIDPDSDIPVSEGSHSSLFGNRNSPTVTYALFVPPFHYDEEEGLYKGGLFLDGNAKGGLVDQAKGPFLNPVEMAMPNGASVAEKVEASSYSSLFKEVYGEDSFDNLDDAYNKVADAIAAFESTKVFRLFDSKYDRFLDGKATLTQQESNGLELFKGKGKCAECHTADIAKDGSHPIFTDFTYDNLGVPANPESPFYDLEENFNPKGIYFKDKGLGAFLKSQGVSNYRKEYGKFRVPTLRNIDITAPYMHNGVFKTLREVVSFYNTRDTRNWPRAEESRNVNKDEIGDLGLSEKEIDDLVAFMKTLTDESLKK